MVTDKKCNYPSPAGKEFVLTGARFAGVNPSSNVLCLGCAFGESVCDLASEFRCKISAFDSDKLKVDTAQSLAIKKKVSHLISFSSDFPSPSLEKGTFELAFLEGDTLADDNSANLLHTVSDLLLPRGWLAFSAPVQLQGSDPKKIASFEKTFRCKLKKEEDYRALANACGFNTHFVGLVPQSGWDNYCIHLANHLEDTRGYYADTTVKLNSHQQIDAFYRLEAFRYIGSLFCVARKRS